MPSRLPTRQQSLAETPPAAPTERPAVRAYRLQLQRVDKLRAQLTELDTLAQWQRDERLRATVPLQRQAQRLAADLVRALDAALQDAPDGGLGPRHRAAAAQALCEHARALAESGDAALAADMTALHDRHSRDSLADLRRAAAQALRSELEGYFGRPLAGADAATDEEDVLHAARQQWHTEREAARAKKAAKAAARQARQGQATPAPAPDAPPPADPAQEARRIYRQLASALHPDREPDPDLRAHKTARMSEANAAYERGDVQTLLRLQRDLNLVPEHQLSDTDDARLAQLTTLLKRQVADLERERAQRQTTLAHEAGLPPGAVARSDTLQQHLQAEAAALQQRVDDLQTALTHSERLDSLKRWLNRRLAAQG